MEIIFKGNFGSHLYGTDTPDSDRDYKGVYLPSIGDCMLNRIKKSISNSTGGSGKNTKHDIDTETYSLQHFIKMAIGGEMVVIDMLHTPDNMVIYDSQLWWKIKRNRKLFYSKNLYGYLRYIRKQASKYGVKGSRLSAMTEVIKVLNKHQQCEKVKEVLSTLPINEHCFFVDNPREKRFKMYQVCGKQIQETISISSAYQIVGKMYSIYGERARLAERNEGVDWKAISHAFRAGYQLIEIYKTGDLVFPLDSREFIKDVKLGKLHYKLDKIGDKLEIMLEEVEELSALSNYPEEVDRVRLEELVVDAYDLS